jgi:hypothetical protein
MDVHVPRAVTGQLRRRGVDVLTAQEDDAGTLDDDQLLERSTRLGRLLVTQDIRFGALAESWQAESRHFAGLAFAHPMEITIGRYVKDLEVISLVSVDGECDDQVYRLPL